MKSNKNIMKSNKNITNPDKNIMDTEIDENDPDYQEAVKEAREFIRPIMDNWKEELRVAIKAKQEEYKKIRERQENVKIAKRIIEDIDNGTLANQIMDYLRTKLPPGTFSDEQEE